MTGAAGEQADAEAGTVGSGLRVPFSADGVRGAGRVRRRLANLVAAKLALDLLFVCGLAAYTHAVTYRTGFEGKVEQADGSQVSGWVVDLERPGASVELQLFLDGQFAAAAVTSEPPAGAAEGPGDYGRRAFVFRFEQPRHGEHEARVYAVRAGRGGARRTLQQIGDPRRLTRK
jgi:hypothetical protein